MDKRVVRLVNYRNKNLQHIYVLCFLEEEEKVVKGKEERCNSAPTVGPCRSRYIGIKLHF